MKDVRRKIIMLFLISVIVFDSLNMLSDGLFELLLRKFPDYSLPFNIVGFFNILASISLIAIISSFFIHKLDKIVDAEMARRLEEEHLLFASIAHDIRTPLTSVRGYVSALKDGKIAKDQKQEVYQKIQSKVDKTTSLLEQLMLYTKLENNFQETPFVALDLNQVTKQVIGDTYEVIEDHAIDLEIALDDKALVMQGNKEQIYRLLENLLLNACYHNEKGSKVSISSKEDKKTIYLWVSDNGKKLEASSLDEITKPFYKNDKARTAKANSNFGLGLAIVKTIVEQHHGNVELINMPAPYTKAFKVSFPKNNP